MDARRWGHLATAPLLSGDLGEIPDDAPLVRLAGAILLDQNDEWGCSAGTDT